MNSEGIRKLKRKFITVMTISFVVVMVLTSFFVNMAMQHANQTRIDQILSFVVESGGEVTNEEIENASEHNRLPGNLYLTRYFTVIADKENNVLSVNLDNIQGITYKQAVSYAMKVLQPDLITKYLTNHQIDSFYYTVVPQDNGGSMVVFVDGTTQNSMRTEVFEYTMILCLSGALITLLIVSLLSNRIIRPEVENAKRQKEFITNASHELKTPLAVIRANTEIIEMMGGENEWTRSTMRQIEHLSSLIQNLVMISRSSEQSEQNIFSDIDLSKAVTEIVEPFKALAIQDKKEYRLKIQEGLKIRADESQMRQLASLLTDNAFKYCDENGAIEVGLSPWKKGKQVHFWVSNSYAEGRNVDYIRFFERFYREDKSHTNQKGFGIGLSLAESICVSYGGTISASWKDGIITFHCILPVTPKDRVMGFSDRVSACAGKIRAHFSRKKKKDAGEAAGRTAKKTPKETAEKKSAEGEREGESIRWE